MKTLINIARIIVGVLFIFSGLVKANDPLGLSYKMQEFFEVWGWGALNNLTLTLSILMIVFEIVAGVAILLGWQMKLFSWLLLLLIIFFTFLTGYALFSGKIQTCGCFGDCIPLTAQQSFMKDLFLLVLILLIFFNYKKIKPLFSGKVSIALLLLSLGASFIFQWNVLTYLPVKDCLPYRVGYNIPEKMKIPAGAIPDSTVISFVYNKAGKDVEFTADSFPADFDDSLYHFVKRYDKVIRKGNAAPAIKDFVLITPSGNDSTDALMHSQGNMYLYFIHDEDNASNWKAQLFEIYKLAQHKNIPFFFVSALQDDKIKALVGKPMQDVLLLKCDAVAVKTACRTNAVLYLINNGTIVNKYSYAKLKKAEDEMPK
jgi:uncharacterized membrane protein YphA (DoxX/SURF4 family)